MKEPVQLSIDFEMTDPRYPRQHDFMQIRTVPELLGDGIVQAANWFDRHRSAISTALHVSVFAGVLAVGYGLGEQYAEEQFASIRPPAAHGFADINHPSDTYCPSAKLTTSELFVSRQTDYQALLDQGSVLSNETYSGIFAKLFRSTSDQAAGTLFVKELASNGVKLRIHEDPDPEAPHVNAERLESLAFALRTIPKSLFDYAGVSIELQSAPTSTMPMGDKSLAMPVGGYFSMSEELVVLGIAELDDPANAADILWHELIGHAVLMKLCNPARDAVLHNINASSGLDISYIPDYLMNETQRKLFDSGIVTENAHGGSNEYEDVATTVDGIINYSLAHFPKQYNGAIDPTNGSILDEKRYHVLALLKTIEPNIEEYIAAYDASAMPS